MIVVVLRTKPSSLYRHRRGLGLHKSVTKEEIYISVLPSLPSMPSRVPSGHGTKSSISYLHSPTVRPKDIVRLSEDPLIPDSLTCAVVDVFHDITKIIITEVSTSMTINHAS